MAEVIVPSPTDSPSFIIAEAGSGKLRHAVAVAFKINGAAEPVPVIYPAPKKGDLLARYDRQTRLYELTDGRVVQQYQLSEIAAGREE